MVILKGLTLQKFVSDVCVCMFYVCEVIVVVFLDWLDRGLIYMWEEFRKVYLLMTWVWLSWVDCVVDRTLKSNYYYYCRWGGGGCVCGEGREGGTCMCGWVFAVCVHLWVFFFVFFFWGGGGGGAVYMCMWGGGLCMWVCVFACLHVYVCLYAHVCMLLSYILLYITVHSFLKNTSDVLCLRSSRSKCNASTINLV